MYYLDPALIKTMFAQQKLVFMYEDRVKGKYGAKLGQLSLSFVC